MSEIPIVNWVEKVLLRFFEEKYAITVKLTKFDPAIGGGVIVTTVTDIVGFFTFLELHLLFTHRYIFF